MGVNEPVAFDAADGTTYRAEWAKDPITSILTGRRRSGSALVRRGQ